MSSRNSAMRKVRCTTVTPFPSPARQKEGETGKMALTVFWVLLMNAFVTGQVAPEQAGETFAVHDPYLEWSLWAAEPLFANPTCMDIDHRGRVWICESVNYRHSLHHLPPNRPEGDRILILEDSHGTGRADKVT